MRHSHDRATCRMGRVVQSSRRLDHPPLPVCDPYYRLNYNSLFTIHKLCSSDVRHLLFNTTTIWAGAELGERGGSCCCIVLSKYVQSRCSFFVVISKIWRLCQLFLARIFGWVIQLWNEELRVTIQPDDICVFVQLFVWIAKFAIAID